MIECIFTIDYEIYGNGDGSLKDLVFEPAEKLINLFNKFNSRFVAFIEAAELEMIDASGTDPAIDLVKSQIKQLYRQGFELGLHLHPQWYNGRYEGGSWQLDYNEYNLCTLPRERITQIVERSIEFLQNVLEDSDYKPISFRAGNWLFQPTQNVSSVLAEQGIKVDSSVFKGGLQRQHKLDYRKTLKYGDYWSFSDYVDVPDPIGALIEIPIYTQMVPFWRMVTAKRVGMQQKASSKSSGSGRVFHQRIQDYLRLFYPLKLDFCRMTIDELTRMLVSVIHEDQLDPTTYRPIVAIGHTKDLVDFKTVEGFLCYLKEKNIAVSSFKNVYQKCY